jgi:hypothetical protein
VIALQQLGAGDVTAEHDAAEEAEAVLLGRLLVDARDRLDLRMVRGDARAHEAERRRQRVQDVYLEAEAQQLVGGIEAGRAGADDDGARGVGGVLGHHAPNPQALKKAIAFEACPWSVSMTSPFMSC